MPILKVTTKIAKEFIESFKNDDNFIIIDIRTPAEYEINHIEGAINIDFYNIIEFKNKLNKLDKSKTYLFYCKSGNRSKQAVNIFNELQFVNVLHMYKGISSY